MLVLVSNISSDTFWASGRVFVNRNIGLTLNSNDSCKCKTDHGYSDDDIDASSEKSSYLTIPKILPQNVIWQHRSFGIWPFSVEISQFHRSILFFTAPSSRYGKAAPRTSSIGLAVVV
jgi:hypothetical protein